MSISDELELPLFSLSILNPRMRLKCLFGEDEGDESGREKVDRAGVVGGEKDIEFPPFGLPLAMKLS
jgi:hypothetical protein